MGWEKNVDFFPQQLLQYVSRGRCKMRVSLVKGWVSMKVRRKRMLSEGVEDKAKWKGVA